MDIMEFPFQGLKPNGLNFETDTKCNAYCSFCQHHNMVKRPPMKWSLILDLLYWNAHRVQWITPFGVQEPLLEPRLPAILASAKQFNSDAATTINSNMSIFPEKMWSEIVRYQTLDNLNVSFYGVDKKTYEELQPPLDYYETQRNIKRLVKLKRRLGWLKPRINMNIMVHPKTVDKLGEFHRKWGSIVDSSGFFHEDRWCGFHKEWDINFQRKIWGEPARERLPCHRLFLEMSVRSDGSLVPCCLDHNIMESCGNMYHHSPYLWWNSPRLNELRTMHLEGKMDEIPLCKDCSVWMWEEPKEWSKIVPTIRNALCAVNPSR